MENLGNKELFGNIYKDKRVLITGHTGFKGSWLMLWLELLGARTFGISLKPPSNPYHYDFLNLKCHSVAGDIRNTDTLQRMFDDIKPDAVFHLAAQPLVRYSYQHPLETFDTNVIGTLNLFEAARKCGSVKAVLNVTSDKCYENREWVWGYRENEPMGGYDPYSASKGCSELLTACYRNSFFPPDQYQVQHQILIASLRAGNVIGGGDWGADRLVPDIMRAAGQNEHVTIRHPHAIRPWQHVLEPLSGYLLVGQQLLEGNKKFAEAWNFGPDMDDHKDVITVVNGLRSWWDKIEFRTSSHRQAFHEANVLKLDCSKAHAKLNWTPVWNSSVAIEKTAEWYGAFYEADRVISREQLAEYLNDAKDKQTVWAIQ